MNCAVGTRLFKELFKFELTNWEKNLNSKYNCLPPEKSIEPFLFDKHKNLCALIFLMWLKIRYL